MGPSGCARPRRPGVVSLSSRRDLAPDRKTLETASIREKIKTCRRRTPDELDFASDEGNSRDHRGGTPGVRDRSVGSSESDRLHDYRQYLRERTPWGSRGAFHVQRTGKP